MGIYNFMHGVPKQSESQVGKKFASNFTLGLSNIFPFFLSSPTDLDFVHSRSEMFHSLLRLCKAIKSTCMHRQPSRFNLSFLLSTHAVHRRQSAFKTRRVRARREQTPDPSTHIIRRSLARLCAPGTLTLHLEKPTAHLLIFRP